MIRNAFLSLIPVLFGVFSLAPNSVVQAADSPYSKSVAADPCEINYMIQGLYNNYWLKGASGFAQILSAQPATTSGVSYGADKSVRFVLQAGSLGAIYTPKSPFPFACFTKGSFKMEFDIDVRSVEFISHSGQVYQSPLNSKVANNPLKKSIHDIPVDWLKPKATAFKSFAPTITVNINYLSTKIEPNKQTFRAEFVAPKDPYLFDNVYYGYVK